MFCINAKTHVGPLQHLKCTTCDINNFQSLTKATKTSVLSVGGVLEPPMEPGLDFVQVLKLSKVAGLQLTTLLKGNYFTARFKLFSVIAFVSPFLIPNNLKYSTASTLRQHKHAL